MSGLKGKNVFTVQNILYQLVFIPMRGTLFIVSTGQKSFTALVHVQ